MGANSKIEWTDHTFNPWWGCHRVSPACANCYAGAFAKRCGHDFFEEYRFFGDKHWAEPLKWNREAEQVIERRKVFCGSMCDVMEDNLALQVPRARLYELIEATPNLSWLLLSKRPENFCLALPPSWLRQPRANVWLGVTAENQDQADRRIPILLATPAVKRFVSVEPMLGPVDLRYLQHNREVEVDALNGTHGVLRPHGGKNARLDWVICGGESASKARPVHPGWVRSLRDQCVAAGVPFFFKQWGEYQPLTRTDGVQEMPFGDYVPEARFGFIKRGKKAAGCLLDGREWKQVS